MDWHPVISVQQQTPDNDFCHFIIFKCTFCILGIFSKTGKTRVSHRVKMMIRWPGCERWPKWPTDPVTQWPSSMSVSHSKSHLKNLECLLSWQSIEVIEFAAIRCRLYRPIISNHSSLVTTSLLRTVSDILPYSQCTQLPDDARDLQVL